MCGIAGALTTPRDPSPRAPADPEAQRLVARMTSALAHRGPDGAGAFADAGPGACAYLGHRRLSIFDPSPRGAQPMSDSSGRYTVVFNGAIYNFIEIAAELSRLPGSRPLRGHSDTEVLVEAWAAWGEGALPRFNGMFAFALWDAATRTLTLARDRLGIKPLHYVYLGDGHGPAGVRLLFASEVKALFTYPGVAPEPDPRALSEFLLTANIDHDPEGSFFAGVLQVPPAGTLQLRPGQPPQLRRYWRLHPAARPRPLDDELIHETRELLLSAATLRLRSDVPLGGTLSGGLDSSLLTGIIAGPLLRQGRVQAPYRVFMSQFPGTAAERHGDESHWAEQMVAALPREAVEPLRSSPDAGALREDLADVLWHQEEPFADSSIYAHYALVRCVARAGVKVLITGQGADEVFGGYSSYRNVLAAELLRRGALGDLLREHRGKGAREQAQLALGAVYHGLPAALRERLYRRRAAGRGSAAYPLSAKGLALWAGAARRYGATDAHGWGTAADPGFGLLDQNLLDCIERWALPHILRQDDRNAMAFGVESRAPYLDYRLVELAFRTASTARIGDGWNKRLLREVGRGLMPEALRLRRDKVGFWSPQVQWLRAQEAWVREVMAGPPDPLREVTDARGLGTLLDRFFRHNDNAPAATLWAGFLSSLWARETLPRLRALGHSER